MTATGTDGSSAPRRPQRAHRVARLETLMLAAGAAWYERDLASGFVFGSESLARLYGLPDPLGPWRIEDFARLISEEDQSLFELTVNDRAPELADAARTVHYRVNHPDGTLRHVEVKYLDVEDDSGRFRIGIVLDITAKRRLEEKLVQEHKALMHAAKAVNMVVWDYDSTLDQADILASGMLLAGSERPKLQWSMTEIISTLHPDDRVPTLRVFLEALHRGHDYSAIYRVVDEMGAYKWVEARGRRYAGPNGEPDRMLGVTWDINERFLSDDRLAGIAKQVPGFVYQYRRAPDGQLSFPYASEGIREVYFLEPEDVYADSSAVRRRLHPDDVARIYDSIQASGDNLSLWHEEYRVIDPAGAMHWLEGRAKPSLQDDGAVLWHGHIVDVTARKIAEGELRDTKERLTLALSAARMLSWQWDLATNHVTSSQPFDDFLDPPERQLTMDDVLASIHPEDLPQVRHIIEVVLDSPPSEDTQMVEYRVLRKHGPTQLVETRARQVLDAERKVVGLRGVTVDITDQKLAQNERNDLRTQLEQAQKMELIGLMTGGIAHDFNNFLASVLGYAGLAQRHLERTGDTKARNYLEHIQEAGEHAADLAGQLLAFSRGDNVQASLQSPAPLVNLAVKMIAPTLPSSVRVTTALEEDLPAVLINPVQVQQIVMNLCLNARDAIEATGTIEISLYRKASTDASCASCRHGFRGDFVVLAIRDSGTGIPDHIVPRIFDALFTTKPPTKGTGLGLPMVHSIVHRAHGHLCLETAAGRGSCFEVYFPVVTR